MADHSSHTATDDTREDAIRSAWQRLAHKHGWGHGIDASVALQSSVLAFLGVDMNRPMDAIAFCPAVAHALQVQTTLRKATTATTARRRRTATTTTTTTTTTTIAAAAERRSVRPSSSSAGGRMLLLYCTAWRIVP